MTCQRALPRLPETHLGLRERGRPDPVPAGAASHRLKAGRAKQPQGPFAATAELTPAAPTFSPLLPPLPFSLLSLIAVPSTFPTPSPYHLSPIPSLSLSLPSCNLVSSFPPSLSPPLPFPPPASLTSPLPLLFLLPLAPPPPIPSLTD